MNETEIQENTLESEEAFLLSSEKTVDAPETSFDDLEIITDVSGNDLQLLTISGSDVGAMTLQAETDIITELQTTNYLLSALLFITLWSWCEQKIKSGIRRLFKHE